jgi:hypothetical protein
MGEAMFLGVLLAGALHLMYGALCPINLVEVYKEGHVKASPSEITVEINILHAFDLLIGGLFLVYLPFRGLKHIYLKPDQL